MDDGHAAADEAVGEGGFSDVRAADDRHGGQGHETGFLSIFLPIYHILERLSKPGFTPICAARSPARFPPAFAARSGFTSAGVRFVKREDRPVWPL
jgi:hypothetical protein